MSQQKLLAVILIVALATYLLRVIPLVLLRKPLREPHVVAFIEYLPYAILTAMVLPGIITATGDARTSIAGFLAALLFALLGFSLPVVALVSTATAYIIGLLL